jgi:hypothetical protein
VNRVVVPFYSNSLKDVSRFQFSLAYDGLQFMDLINGALEIEDSEFSIIDGNLFMSVANAEKFQAIDSEALFYLVFEAISEGILSESMYLNNKILRPEIYHGKDLLISELELGFISRVFRLFRIIHIFLPLRQV